MSFESRSRLGEVSREYQEKADSADQVYGAAARAEAGYKKARAKAVLRFKTDAERMSQAEAETRADADDEVARLHETYLVAKAAADALKAKLTQLREQNANGRTAVVDERGVDELHGRGYGGAA